MAVPICKTCGGTLVPLQTKPGKGGKSIWYVGCPNCKGQKQPEKAATKKQPSEKPEAEKKDDFLDDWL